MSMVPVTPNMDKLKSFWQKPQGKVGMVTLALGAVGLGLGFMNYLLPYATTFVDGWLHIGMTVAVIFFLGWFYTEFHSRFALIFKIIITRLTNVAFHVMPIDVLKDNIKMAQKRQTVLEDNERVFNDQIRVLKDNIARNEQEAQHQFGIAIQARNKKAQYQPSQIEYITYQASETQAANEAQRKKDSNASYTAMLKQLEAVSNVIGRMKVAVAFFVADRTAVVKETEFKYNALKKAHKAVSSAKTILRGDADQETLFQDTLDFVNQRDSEMLGDIENYQNMAEEFMRKSDLETGAVNDRAMEQLNAMEQKLLTPGNPITDLQSAQAGAMQKQQPLAVPVNIPSGYNDLFK
jgi:hypothetical protein